MKQILYVVNPRSGVGRKTAIERAIREQTDKRTAEIDIVRTTHPGHAREIATAWRDKIDAVVAVGGDGTVNEVGSGLMGSTTALGIIPCGSGNGLARELDIPLRASSAIDVINETSSRPIDVLSVDGKPSLNVAGVGFDAYISHEFAKKRVRGPLQYASLIAKEYPVYNCDNYRMSIDGDLYEREALLISFANSGQWGNNIHIAPHASMDDGQMDVCVIAHLPSTALPSVLVALLSQNIDTNKYDEMIRTKRVELLNEQPLIGHIDGEPCVFGPHTKIYVRPLALNVIAPSADWFRGQRFMPSRVREQIGRTLLDPIGEIRNRLRDI